MTPTVTHTQSHLVGWSGTVTFEWDDTVSDNGVTVWFLPVLFPSVPRNLQPSIAYTMTAMTTPWMVDTERRQYSRSEARGIWRCLTERGFMRATEEKIANA